MLLTGEPNLESVGVVLKRIDSCFKCQNWSPVYSVNPHTMHAYMHNVCILDNTAKCSTAGMLHHQMKEETHVMNCRNEI